MSGLAVGLGAQLGAGVASRVAVLERAAPGLRAPAELAAIRAELLAVARMWRRAVAAHRPAEGDGRCAECRGLWRRRRRWPCAVFTAAHAALLALEGPDAGDSPTETARGVRSGESPLRSGAGGASPRPGVTVTARHARPGHRMRRARDEALISAGDPGGVR